MDPKKSSNKQKNANKVRQQNVLEALKDIGHDTSNSFKKDLVGGMPQDFFEQLFGRKPAPRKVSGDLMPGESMNIDAAKTGEHEKAIKEARQAKFMNTLKEEEMHLIRTQSNELKLKLNQLQAELSSLAVSTGKLAEESVTAAMTVTTEPDVYHIGYVEKIIIFVKSFNKTISSAGLWMQESNKRAAKKGAGTFGKKIKDSGTKFLFAPDHYASRSGA